MNVASSARRLTSALVASVLVLLLLTLATWTIVLLAAGSAPTGVLYAAVFSTAAAVVLSAVFVYFTANPTSISVNANRLAHVAGAVGTFLLVYGPIRLLSSVFVGQFTFVELLIDVAFSLAGYGVWRRGYAHWSLISRERLRALLAEAGLSDLLDED